MLSIGRWRLREHQTSFEKLRGGSGERLFCINSGSLVLFKLFFEASYESPVAKEKDVVKTHETAGKNEEQEKPTQNKQKIERKLPTKMPTPYESTVLSPLASRFDTQF